MDGIKKGITVVEVFKKLEEVENRTKRFLRNWKYAGK